MNTDPAHEVKPLISAVTMGYGHLRAAYPLADAFGVDVVAVDEPPLADASEVQLWTWVRRMHEVLSKPMPMLRAFDGPARALMDAATMIPPLHEPRDHRSPTWSVRVLDQLVRRGLGRGMVEQLRRSGAPLLTTFYAPAIIADRAGIEQVYCVVTDADCNRVWAPIDASSTRIQYFAPSRRVIRRLLSFGVPERNITLTGFPLPQSLTNPSGDSSLRSRVAQRIARLDVRSVFRGLHHEELDLSFPGEWDTAASNIEQPPASGPVQTGSSPGSVSPRASKPALPTRPVSLLFAVGGAGAQVELAAQFLPSLRPKIVRGELRIHLVAGTREEVRREFLKMVKDAGLDSYLSNELIADQPGGSVHVHFAPTFRQYYTLLNAVLADIDVLWTKPSEMSFYAALGLPCIIAPPVGSHERYNRRWLREQGVGLKQRRPDYALGWFDEWLEDGTLAAAAWSGFMRLPKHGTERIVRIVTDGVDQASLAPGPAHVGSQVTNGRV